MAGPEPARRLVVADLETVVGPLREGEVVWALEDRPDRGTVLVEHRDRRFEVPQTALVATPVPPPMDRLLALDPCFDRDRRELREVHVDEQRVFRVLECEHGNLFLEDTVTGIGWHSRLLFMGGIAHDPSAYVEFWERHHRLSTDHLHILGIGL